MYIVDFDEVGISTQKRMRRLTCSNMAAQVCVL